MTRAAFFLGSAHSCLAMGALLIAGMTTTFAEDLRVYEPGQQPNDARL